jgi:hypothetical protein
MLSPLETGTSSGRLENVEGAGKPVPCTGIWHRRAARGSSEPGNWPTWGGEAGQGPSISYMEGPFLILQLPTGGQLMIRGATDQRVNLQLAAAAAQAGRDQRRGQGSSARPYPRTGYSAS